MVSRGERSEKTEARARAVAIELSRERRRGHCVLFSEGLYWIRSSPGLIRLARGDYYVGTTTADGEWSTDPGVHEEGEFLVMRRAPALHRALFQMARDQGPRLPAPTAADNSPRFWIPCDGDGCERVLAVPPHFPAIVCRRCREEDGEFDEVAGIYQGGE